MREFVALNNQLRKSVEAKTPKEQPYGRHHGYDAEISRGEKPRQNDDGPHADDEIARLARDGGSCPPHRFSTKLSSGGNGMKRAIRLKGSHELSFASVRGQPIDRRQN
jgi:hypothetical protein